jgi:hypothetical protein
LAGCYSYIKPSTASQVLDASGQSLIFAPRTTFNLGADYNTIVQ